MDRILAISCFLLALVIVLVAFPEGATAVLVLTACSVIAVAIIRHSTEDDGFLQRIFIIGLLLRIAFGTIIHVFDLRDFLGSDALLYDELGSRLAGVWAGNILPNADYLTQRATEMTGPGWGMNYVVGFIYSIVGRNILAAQFFCAVIGAAIAPMVYYCTYKIFGNRKVGSNAAWIVAVFPAFIIWTSQLLKDGLVIFLLVLSMFAVLQLLEKLNYKVVGLLIFSLFGLVTLRFYIAYIVAIAILGSFLIAHNNSIQSIFRRVTALVIITLGLAYLGIFSTAEEDINKYGNLERIQISREYLASASQSGYVEDDSDVTTVGGAILALPIGFIYLILAPFPWEVSNFRQLITLPEVLLWWAMMPLLISGLWYTIKHRLRKAIGVLLFTLMLSIGYSLFQGNVGTAYRQRAQIQVFLFIFISVGWTLRQEKKENQKLAKSLRQQKIRQRLQAKT
ncbi:MAG: glycosyltransferase family 39 protein [Acidobacteria bacterium]|nr:glycosyltransferase family 39 protein [Acidobacteriota bacterium]